MTEWIHDLTLYSPLKMTHSKISISEEGVLLNPVLHDAKLLGVLTFESKRTLVIAQLRSGEINGMWLIGVERLNATNFYAGNIILDCTVESGPRANCDQAFKDLGLAQDKGAQAYLELLRVRIRRSELKIVTINPSYGCEFCALCREIESWDVEGDKTGLLVSIQQAARLAPA
jgi:hypothetical protein